MKRTWTIIGVRDVPRSFRWYQSLFGQPETEPAHSFFGQLLDADGTVLLCLHQWGAHDHPSLMPPRDTPGLLDACCATGIFDGSTCASPHAAHAALLDAGLRCTLDRRPRIASETAAIAAARDAIRAACARQHLAFD